MRCKTELVNISFLMLQVFTSAIIYEYLLDTLIMVNGEYYSTVLDNQTTQRTISKKIHVLGNDHHRVHEGYGGVVLGDGHRYHIACPPYNPMFQQAMFRNY